MEEDMEKFYGINFVDFKLWYCIKLLFRFEKFLLNLVNYNMYVYILIFKYIFLYEVYVFVMN